MGFVGGFDGVYGRIFYVGKIVVLLGLWLVFVCCCIVYVVGGLLLY